MRIYEGSPRTDWEEVLRSVGAFADRELLKELIFLELEAGFVLQGLAQPNVGQWSESSGMLAKKTFELVDDQIGQLIDESIAPPSGGDRGRPAARRGRELLRAGAPRHRRLGGRPASARRLVLRAGRLVRRAPAHRVAERHRTPAGGVHARRDSGYDRCGTTATKRRAAATRSRLTRQHAPEADMKALKVLLLGIGALLAALIVIPLTILAGLFVWLKLTEETDDEEMELEDTI